jgi:hypothetical protein
VIEYLAKLRRICEGALRCKTDVAKEQRQWWLGYQQCLDDVGAFAEKNADLRV